MSVFGTPSRLPQDQPGRDIRCTSCGWLVRVQELPVEFIDDALFVCGACMESNAGQLELDGAAGRREPEVRPYDPKIARIPYAPQPLPGEPVIPR